MTSGVDPRQHCPMCWSALEPDMRFCPGCGSDLSAPEVVRLAELDMQIGALSGARRLLVDEIVARRTATASVPVLPGLPPPPDTGFSHRPPPPEAPQRYLPPPPIAGAARARDAATGEFQPASLASLLSWAGVSLLVLAGLIFTVVAWPSMGAGSRAGFLVILTVAAGGASFRSYRRLPTTSEALSVVFLAFLLIDWVALAQVGFADDVDPALWMAAGMAGVGAVATVVGVLSEQKAPRICAALAFPTAGLLLAAECAHDLRAGGLGLTAVATASVIVGSVASGSRSWRGFAATIAGFAMFVMVPGVAMVAYGISTYTPASTLGSSSAVLACGLPFVCLRLWFEGVRARKDLDGLLGALTASAVIGAIAVFVSAHVSDRSMFVVVTALGLVVLEASRLAKGRPAAGLAPAGLLVLSCAALGAGAIAFHALGRTIEILGPARWADSMDLYALDPEMTGSDVFAVLAVTVVLMVATLLESVDLGGSGRRLPTKAALAASVVSSAVLVVLVPFGFELQLPVILAAYVVVVLGLTAVVVAMGRVGEGWDEPRRHLRLALVSLASFVWFTGALWSSANCWTTVAALAIGAGATALFSMTAAGSVERWGFASLSGSLSLVALWIVLAARGVTVLEAYTWPTAASVVVVGWFWRQRQLQRQMALGSWIAYGPGLMIAFGPTLMAVLDGQDPTRALALTIGSLGVTAVGVARRLQAPAILGIAVLLAVAVDQLWSYAMQVPRWALIAAAGAVFIWAGATFERRRRDVHALGGVLGRMG